MSNPGLQSTVPPAVVTWLHPDGSAWESRQVFHVHPCVLHSQVGWPTKLQVPSHHFWPSFLHSFCTAGQPKLMAYCWGTHVRSILYSWCTHRVECFLHTQWTGRFVTYERVLNLWMLDVSADYRLHVCFNSTSILPICLQLGSTAWRWTALCRWFRRTTCTWPLTGSYWLFFRTSHRPIFFESSTLGGTAVSKKYAQSKVHRMETFQDAVAHMSEEYPSDIQFLYFTR